MRWFRLVTCSCFGKLGTHEGHHKGAEPQADVPGHSSVPERAYRLRDPYKNGNLQLLDDTTFPHLCRTYFDDGLAPAIRRVGQPCVDSSPKRQHNKLSSHWQESPSSRSAAVTAASRPAVAVAALLLTDSSYAHATSPPSCKVLWSAFAAGMPHCGDTSVPLQLTSGDDLPSARPGYAPLLPHRPAACDNNPPCSRRLAPSQVPPPSACMTALLTWLSIRDEGFARDVLGTAARCAVRGEYFSARYLLPADLTGASSGAGTSGDAAGSVTGVAALHSIQVSACLLDPEGKGRLAVPGLLLVFHGRRPLEPHGNIDGIAATGERNCVVGGGSGGSTTISAGKANAAASPVPPLFSSMPLTQRSPGDADAPGRAAAALAISATFCTGPGAAAAAVATSRVPTTSNPAPNEMACTGIPSSAPRGPAATPGSEGRAGGGGAGRGTSSGASGGGCGQEAVAADDAQLTWATLAFEALPACVLVFECEMPAAASEADLRAAGSSPPPALIRPGRLAYTNAPARAYMGWDPETPPAGDIPGLPLLRQIFCRDPEQLGQLLGEAAASPEGFDAVVAVPAWVDFPPAAALASPAGPNQQPPAFSRHALSVGHGHAAAQRPLTHFRALMRSASTPFVPAPYPTIGLAAGSGVDAAGRSSPSQHQHTPSSRLLPLRTASSRQTPFRTTAQPPAPGQQDPGVTSSQHADRNSRTISSWAGLFLRAFHPSDAGTQPDSGGFAFGASCDGVSRGSRRNSPSVGCAKPPPPPPPPPPLLPLLPLPPSLPAAALASTAFPRSRETATAAALVRTSSQVVSSALLPTVTPALGPVKWWLGGAAAVPRPRPNGRTPLRRVVTVAALDPRASTAPGPGPGMGQGQCWHPRGPSILGRQCSGVLRAATDDRCGRIAGVSSAGCGGGVEPLQEGNLRPATQRPTLPGDLTLSPPPMSSSSQQRPLPASHHPRQTCAVSAVLASFVSDAPLSPPHAHPQETGQLQPVQSPDQRRPLQPAILASKADAQEAVDRGTAGAVSSTAVGRRDAAAGYLVSGSCSTASASQRQAVEARARTTLGALHVSAAVAAAGLAFEPGMPYSTPSYDPSLRPGSLGSWGAGAAPSYATAATATAVSLRNPSEVASSPFHSARLTTLPQPFEASKPRRIRRGASSLRHRVRALLSQVELDEGEIVASPRLHRHPASLTWQSPPPASLPSFWRSSCGWDRASAGGVPHGSYLHYASQALPKLHRPQNQQPLEQQHDTRKQLQEQLHEQQQQQQQQEHQRQRQQLGEDKQQDDDEGLVVRTVWPSVAKPNTESGCDTSASPRTAGAAWNAAASSPLARDSSNATFLLLSTSVLAAPVTPCTTDHDPHFQPNHGDSDGVPAAGTLPLPLQQQQQPHKSSGTSDGAHIDSSAGRQPTGAPGARAGKGDVGSGRPARPISSALRRAFGWGLPTLAATGLDTAQEIILASAPSATEYLSASPPPPLPPAPAVATASAEAEAAVSAALQSAVPWTDAIGAAAPWSTSSTVCAAGCPTPVRAGSALLGSTASRGEGCDATLGAGAGAGTERRSRWRAASLLDSIPSSPSVDGGSESGGSDVQKDGGNAANGVDGAGGAHARCNRSGSDGDGGCSGDASCAYPGDGGGGGGSSVTGRGDSCIDQIAFVAGSGGDCISKGGNAAGDIAASARESRPGPPLRLDTSSLQHTPVHSLGSQLSAQPTRATTGSSSDRRIRRFNSVASAAAAIFRLRPRASSRAGSSIHAATSPLQRSAAASGRAASSASTASVVAKEVETPRSPFSAAELVSGSCGVNRGPVLTHGSVAHPTHTPQPTPLASGMQTGSTTASKAVEARSSLHPVHSGETAKTLVRLPDAFSSASVASEALPQPSASLSVERKPVFTTDSAPPVEPSPFRSLAPHLIAPAPASRAASRARSLPRRVCSALYLRTRLGSGGGSSNGILSEQDAPLGAGGHGTQGMPTAAHALRLPRLPSGIAALIPGGAAHSAHPPPRVSIAAAASAEETEATAPAAPVRPTTTSSRQVTCQQAPVEDRSGDRIGMFVAAGAAADAGAGTVASAAPLPAYGDDRFSSGAPAASSAAVLGPGPDHPASAALASAARGELGQEVPLAAPVAHHRVRAWRRVDPGSGRDLLVVHLHDVTALVQGRERALRLLLQEHKILEALFPRHVLTFLALNPGALETQTDTRAAQRGSSSGVLAGPHGPSGPIGSGLRLTEQQRGLRRLGSRLLAGSSDGAAAAAGGGGRGGGRGSSSAAFALTLRRMLAAQHLASARVSQLATQHRMVTILFTDCVGFTNMCRQIEPRLVMGFLNELYSRCDALLDIHRVCKVETIGDAYVVAGGLVRYDSDGFRSVLPEGEVDPLHAVRVMEFARAMLRVSREVLMPHIGEPVRLRLGVHSGPVISGVVGTKQPRFTVFGETVEVAKRMESRGTPGRIHVSATTRSVLLAASRWSAAGCLRTSRRSGPGATTGTYLWEPAVDGNSGGVGGSGQGAGGGVRSGGQCAGAGAGGGGSGAGGGDHGSGGGAEQGRSPPRAQTATRAAEFGVGTGSPRGATTLEPVDVSMVTAAVAAAGGPVGQDPIGYLLVDNEDESAEVLQRVAVPVGVGSLTCQRRYDVLE